jgi:hypothetical protein
MVITRIFFAILNYGGAAIEIVVNKTHFFGGELVSCLEMKPAFVEGNHCA